MQHRRLALSSTCSHQIVPSAVQPLGQITRASMSAARNATVNLLLMSLVRSEAIDAPGLYSSPLTSCFLPYAFRHLVSHHVLMDFVISVRFLTSLCKDRSNTAICCCIVNTQIRPSPFVVACVMSASKASKAMMLSNRLVVSRAASSLLSWRLAVFIFHCL